MKLYQGGRFIFQWKSNPHHATNGRVNFKGLTWWLHVCLVTVALSCVRCNPSCRPDWQPQVEQQVYLRFLSTVEESCCSDLTALRWCLDHQILLTVFNLFTSLCSRLHFTCHHMQSHKKNMSFWRQLQVVLQSLIPSLCKYLQVRPFSGPNKSL